MDNNTVIQSIKFSFAAASGVLVHLLGGGDGILRLLGALIAFDFFLGVLKGIKTTKFKSSIVRWGAVNKALEIIVIMVFNLFDGATHMEIFRNGAVVWFCVCEASSVFENLIILGIPCPEGLHKVLVKLKVGISISFVDILEKIVDEKLLPRKNGGIHDEKNND